ncbi:unnamed protein product, partial [marine sediment metagenome]
LCTFFISSTCCGSIVIASPTYLYTKGLSAFANNFILRFLEDISEEMIDNSKQETVNSVEGLDKNNKELEPKPQFKEGDKVNHSKFGQGVIVQIDGDGDTAQVAFAGKGVKKLSLSVAPLKKIN